jgi:GDP-4-dehydro-6-deoxy-D-mannose reductase
MKVLITGASGFTGTHLIKYLLSLPEDSPSVIGISRSPPRISHPDYRYIRTDLENEDQINFVFDKTCPDAVIHLAGRNKGNLTELLQSNVISTESLLNVILKKRPDARIIVVGSSAEYGYAGTEPIAENAPLHPVGLYGISKVAEDLLSISYRDIYELGIAVARPFNLIGPGQPDSFVCGSLTRQAAEIQGGLRAAFELTGGNATRDFIDVRDEAVALWRLLSHDNFDNRIVGRAFNIGTGKGYSIFEVIQEIFSVMGKSYPISGPGVPARELVPIQIADTTSLKKETGWQASIPIRRSLEDMIARWRGSAV